MKNASLIAHLTELLHGGHAHATFDSAVKKFPVERAGDHARGLPHSAWELLEHIRITQNDILRFSQEVDYQSPDWPKGYWPASPAPSSETQWQQSVRLYRRDLKAFEKLLADRADSLDRPFPWGQGQTLLREALLIADHTAYHLGQLVLVRRALGIWDKT
jgi:uncharacterized damage-inducible protein DinB